MIRFSKFLFSEGINSIKKYLSNIDPCNILNFFTLTADTLESLITNNKHKTFKEIYLVINQLSDSYKLTKQEKIIIYLLIGYYIFLSIHFKNREERDSLNLFVSDIINKDNLDYLIYFQDGHILAGCSIIYLNVNNQKIVWNTYTFVLQQARKKGILKKIYNYFDKQPIVIEVENPYYFYNINQIRDNCSGKYFPNSKKSWNNFTSSTELDMFSRVLIWSKMGFNLPIFKTKIGNLKINQTYNYLHPTRKSQTSLGYFLLFKNLSITKLSQILQIEQAMLAEYHINISRELKDKKVKLIALHNKDNCLNSLAMASLRGSDKTCI